MVADKEMVARKFSAIAGFLDERQRRLWLAVEARELGHGGVAVVSRATGVSRPTIAKGIKELQEPFEAVAVRRARRSGGGRKQAIETDPALADALETLLEPPTSGDRRSPLRWTSKSTRELAAALAATNHQASHTLVARLLRQLGYSLQSAVKSDEHAKHPDRVAQFRYLTAQVNAYLAAGQPVVSVETRKKKLADAYKTVGRGLQPMDAPEEPHIARFHRRAGQEDLLHVHDAPAHAAWMPVGPDRDTLAFAAQTLRCWWQSMGKATCPQAARLLVCADLGGCHDHRTRVWKVELARLAAETRLEITACHLPAGTSRWDRIEQRVSAHVCMSWCGLPMTSHEAVVQLIAATRSRSAIRAELKAAAHPTGVKITDAQMARLPLEEHGFHGEWNYTLRARFK